MRWERWLVVWSLVGALVVTGAASADEGAVEADAPGVDDLVRVLQTRLDRDFRKGLFKVGETELRATVPFQVPGDDGERLRVFYRTELRFQRSQRLADWDSLNAGSLIWVLGSTPRNVQGIVVEGNRKGDLLQVLGSVSFSRDGDRWRATANDARMPGEPAPDGEQPAPSYRERQLARLDALRVELEGADASDDVRHMQGQLDRLISDLESRVALQRGLLRLATGVPSGAYHALGVGLREELNVDQEQLYTVRSSGSAANCAMVESGQADVAFSQNDIAYMAFHGQGLFQDTLPMGRLRALASLYPEAIQLVTRADSGIESVSDLAGRTVDVGPDASGIRVNAAQLLAAAGMSMDALERVQGKPVGEALDDLVFGQVDAVFVTGVYPYPEIAAHAARTPLRFVPLSEALVETLWQEAPFMLPMTLPAHTYPGQDEDVRTAGVTAMLVARDDLPDDDVRAILETLFGGGYGLTRHSAQAWLISAETAGRGLSIPLHPAARAFLQGKD